MSFRNPLTNMFEPKTERYTRLIAEVDQQDTDAQAEDSRAVIALADALASDAPDLDLVAALRAKRKTLAETREELRVVRGHYVVELAKAQQEAFEAEHAKELAEQKKAAQVRKNSVAQHVAELRRCLGPIPEHLAAIHKAIACAEQEIEKAELITGAPFVGVDGVASLLRRAVKAAALENWLREPVWESDQSEIRALSTELDAQLDAAMESFEYAIGLKTYIAPEPAAAEIAAQEDVERRAAAAELHQRRIETDPEYRASMFPVPGSAPPEPRGEHTDLRGNPALSPRQRQRADEKATNDALRRGMSPGAMAAEHGRHEIRDRVIDPWTGRPV